jgi:adenylate cyclase class IV
LKAAAADLGLVRKRLRAFGAGQEKRPLDQVDWYFRVPRGRLKLRQRKGEDGAELIFYIRPDARTARTSEYQKLPVTDVKGTLRLLRTMFTPGACVRKHRDLWLRDDTRIHLDRVQALGSFVEIEVPFARDKARARRIMRAVRDCLDIAPRDVLSCSYADLLDRRSAKKADR